LAVETRHALSLRNNLPEPALEIVENLESALDNFKSIITQLKGATPA
jgi:hypothetical protein